VFEVRTYGVADTLAAERSSRFEEVLLEMEDLEICLSVGVDDTSMQTVAMQVDPSVEFVVLVAEIHSVPPWESDS
jgi:hypothetical protein